MRRHNQDNYRRLLVRHRSFPGLEPKDVRAARHDLGRARARGELGRVGASGTEQFKHSGRSRSRSDRCGARLVANTQAISNRNVSRPMKKRHKTFWQGQRSPRHRSRPCLKLTQKVQTSRFLTMALQNPNTLVARADLDRVRGERARVVEVHGLRPQTTLHVRGPRPHTLSRPKPRPVPVAARAVAVGAGRVGGGGGHGGGGGVERPCGRHAAAARVCCRGGWHRRERVGLWVLLDVTLDGVFAAPRRHGVVDPAWPTKTPINPFQSRSIRFR